jgi:hypothetical protein
MRYILIIAALFCSLPQIFAQNNITYGAGISYTNGAPSFTPPARTSRVAIDTITGKWYHFNTPGGWQLLGNTIEEIAGCSAPAYTPTKGDSKVVINNCAAPELYYWTGSAWVWINEGTTYYAGEGIRIENDTIILDSLKLNELHDVFVPNPINNQVLTWDNIDKRWEAKTVADSSPTNEIQTLSTGTNTLTLSDGGGTVTVDTDPGDDVTGSGASGQVSFWNGTQTQSGDNGLYWNNTEKRLGIGTISPETGLDVLSNNGTMRLQRNSNDNQQPFFAFRKSRGTLSAQLPVVERDLLGAFGFIGFGPSAYLLDRAFIGAQVTGSVTSTDLPTSIYFKASSTASPYNASLYIHHSGRTRVGNNSFVGATLPQPNAKLEVIGEGTTSTTWTAQFHNSAGNNNALMIRDDGNVGIGVATPAQRLDVNGNIKLPNNNYLMWRNAANNADIQVIALNNTNTLTFGSASSSVPTTITFFTSATERLRVTSTGLIGINTTSPTDNIDINGANGYSQLRLRTAYTPTGTADGNGNTGDVAWDADYIYIKTAAGWKRSALSTF